MFLQKNILRNSKSVFFPKKGISNSNSNKSFLFSIGKGPISNAVKNFSSYFNGKLGVVGQKEKKVEFFVK